MSVELSEAGQTYIASPRPGETAHRDLKRLKLIIRKSCKATDHHSVHEFLELFHREHPYCFRRWLGLEDARALGAPVPPTLQQNEAETHEELRKTRLRFVRLFSSRRMCS